MARPKKDGLDYFPFDIDFFDDEKIMAISGEFGIKGEITVIKLLCAIYRNGYFIMWNDLLKYKLLKGLPGISSELLESIVNRLVLWEFFDKALFDSTHILTSRGIQKRYFEAVKRRIKKDDDFPYLLVNVDNRGVSAYINPSRKELMSTETPQSKVKEKKENSNTPNVVLEKKKAAKAVSEKSDPASAAQSNFQRIFDYFNTQMDGKAIKTISRLTDKRKSMVRARCSEYGLQSVYDVIDKSAKSLFLNGNNDRGWTADFDWIFRPNNFPKVLEGNYDKANRPQKPNTEREKLASAVEIKAEYGHDDTSYGKFMVFLSERATYICEHYVLPTRELFENLVDKMGKRNVMDTVMALENNYYERRKYTNLYETLNELNMGDKT